MFKASRSWLLALAVFLVASSVVAFRLYTEAPATHIKLGTAASINFTRAAQLRKTYYIEYILDNGNVINTIRNPITIQRIATALDQPITVEPGGVLCKNIPHLAFHRIDNVVANFAYLCGGDHPIFLGGSTSDGSFSFQGIAVLPATVQNELMVDEAPIASLIPFVVLILGPILTIIVIGIRFKRRRAI